MRRTDEMWVEVPLTDGQLLMGMLRLRDDERVVLRHAHWVWADVSGPVVEYVEVDHPWRDCVELPAEDVEGVFSAHSYEQKWNITSFPPAKRAVHRRWSKKHWRPFGTPLLRPRTAADALAAGWDED
jgi:hypothetical protein